VDVKAYCRRHGRDPVDFIFPRRFLWKQEQESDGGDKSKAATAFLDEALPFLAEVAIQDGIYWIEKFPNHPASLHLLHVMPADFPQFAATARASLATASSTWNSSRRFGTTSFCRKLNSKTPKFCSFSNSNSPKLRTMTTTMTMTMMAMAVVMMVMMTTTAAKYTSARTIPPRAPFGDSSVVF
jgi:hypothetical protein